ncbi:cytochrome P450 704B1 [Selaginella moellendorffii]|uniref:cytochrome P450 704B1 n=1 Tax=Selaginella moellendorffii TaxID=88036 RepID=UPI000D1C7D1A|nr:cytochrome P450 704B1 [Selaginella moellendorffii]|eukprot:XP_024517947.1 cytochrome P450 704B1 [Selaginella moellendorffii]
MEATVLAPSSSSSSTMASKLFSFLPSSSSSPWLWKWSSSSQSFSSGAWTWIITWALILAWWIFLHRFRQGGLRGPKSWPLVGCLFEQIANFDRLHHWLLDYHHKTWTFSAPVLGVNNTFTAHPANVEYILKTNFVNYPKGELLRQRFRDMMGYGIFNVDGEMWMHQRKVATVEFASSKLRDYSTFAFRDLTLKLAGILADRSGTGQALDLQDLFLRLTLDSICKIGFGVEIGCLRPDLPLIPFAHAFDYGNTLIIRRYIDMFWKIKRFFNAGSERELKRCIRVMDDFLYRVIERRRQELKQSKDVGRPDILSRFLSLDEEEAYTDKMLRDVVINFVIAGRDTTALTLSWLFSELAKRPEVVEKILAEVDRVFGADEELEGKDSMSKKEQVLAKVANFSRRLDYQGLNRLHYLQATLTEALRLYPAVPLETKTVVADDVLPDGFSVKGGQFVSYSSWAMGRLEEIWGPDVLEFKPERWLRSDNIFQPQSPFKLTAFQAGPRICLGKDSAYLQMKITTILLLRFFKFELLDEKPVNYRMMVVLYMANGLLSRVSFR